MRGEPIRRGFPLLYRADRSYMARKIVNPSAWAAFGNGAELPHARKEDVNKCLAFGLPAFGQ